MHGPNVDRFYDQLKPPERLRLVLEAMAREDAADTQRLTGSCPRKGFTGPDRRFHDRILMAFDIAAVVLIDLRCMWGKLDVLQWVVGDVVKELATYHHVTAAMAFLDGGYCGQGEPQIHFFARPLEDLAGEGETTDEDGADGGDGPGGDASERDDGEDEEDDKDDREWSKVDMDRGRRMHAVQQRAEHATTCGVLSIALAQKDIAQDLVETWAAFGRFCRTRVGVPPETLLRAWAFPMEEFEETLKRYARLKPDPQKVDQYTKYICRNWDERFGKRRRDNDGDAEDEESDDGESEEEGGGDGG